MAELENTGNQIRKILIFEWLNGGGCWFESKDPSECSDLLVQGQQMLNSVSIDFLTAGFEVFTLVDSRGDLDIPVQQLKITHAAQLETTLHQWAGRCDFVLVIAPESDNCLEHCLRWIKEYHRKWLNPGLGFTRLATDKNRTQEFLGARNIPIPQGTCGSDWDRNGQMFAGMQLVVKPFDGCGGEGNFLISYDELQEAISKSGDVDTPLQLRPQRIEEFVDGTAVSVGVLGWDGQRKLQKPMRQNFTVEPFGTFLNCSDDLLEQEKQKAFKLASQVANVLPPFRGYIGIDMVVGRKDVVVEINPRVTVSCALQENAAAWFLKEMQRSD